MRSTSRGRDVAHRQMHRRKAEKQLARLLHAFLGPWRSGPAGDAPVFASEPARPVELDPVVVDLYARRAVEPIRWAGEALVYEVSRCRA